MIAHTPRRERNDGEGFAANVLAHGQRVGEACARLMGSTSLDLDELSLIKKRRPWGWFFAGLLLIGLAGFLLGFFVPLREAHHLLAGEHEKLGQKARELDDSLVTTRKALEAESEKVRAFERGEREVTRAKRLSLDQTEVLRDSITAGLKTLADKKILLVDASAEGARATLPADVVFPRGAKAVSPGLTKSLCTLVKSAKEQSTLGLVVEVPLPAPHDASALTLGTAQLTSLAGVLSGTCRVPPERVRLSLVPAEGKSEPSAGGSAAASTVAFSFVPPVPKATSPGGLLEGSGTP